MKYLLLSVLIVVVAVISSLWYVQRETASFVKSRIAYERQLEDLVEMQNMDYDLYRISLSAMEAHIQQLQSNGCKADAE